MIPALLFIRRVAETTTVSAVTDEYVRSGHVHASYHTLPSASSASRAVSVRGNQKLRHPRRSRLASRVWCCGCAI
jgi:hypothetical protein